LMWEWRIFHLLM